MDFAMHKCRGQPQQVEVTWANRHPMILIDFDSTSFNFVLRCFCIILIVYTMQEKHNKYFLWASRLGEIALGTSSSP